MKHVKKFESFVNETVDPINEGFFSGIIDALVNKYKEWRNKRDLLNFAMLKMEKMIKAGDYPNEIYRSLTDGIDADVTHLVSHGKQYFGETGGMLDGLPYYEIFELMRKAAYNCRQSEAYINMIDRAEMAMSK